MARPKKLPTVLTEDEQERLLEQANPRYPTGERNQTMLRLVGGEVHSLRAPRSRGESFCSGLRPCFATRKEKRFVQQPTFYPINRPLIRSPYFLTAV